jgi:uncharacterized protein (DUF302 family)
VSPPGIHRPLQMSFDDALAKLPGALKSEGFGVLTEIDVQHTLKEKLGVEFRRYRILGACNPPLAHQALQAELEIGQFLPCNVIVYETGPGQCMVVAVDPLQTMSLLGIPALEPVARQVREKLERALALLA